MGDRYERHSQITRAEVVTTSSCAITPGKVAGYVAQAVFDVWLFINGIARHGRRIGSLLLTERARMHKEYGLHARSA